MNQILLWICSWHPQTLGMCNSCEPTLACISCSLSTWLETCLGHGVGIRPRHVGCRRRAGCAECTRRTGSRRIFPSVHDVWTLEERNQHCVLVRWPKNSNRRSGQARQYMASSYRPYATHAGRSYAGSERRLLDTRLSVRCECVRRPQCASMGCRIGTYQVEVRVRIIVSHRWIGPLSAHVSRPHFVCDVCCMPSTQHTAHQRWL